MFLPVELLQKIFLQLCPPGKPTYFPPGSKEPRLILAHVSPQWRAIAFATPELWDNIVIDHPSVGNDSHLHNLLRIWLSNSSQSTLSFQFTRTYAYDCSLVLNQLIFPIVHRCSALTLDLKDATFYQLLSLPPGSFTSLQTININATADSDSTKRFIESQSVTAFCSSPNLRHVALDFYGDRINIAHFNLPWHQLSTLTMKWCVVPADSFLDVMRECASLRSCRMFLSDIDHDTLQKVVSLSGSPLVLSSLQTLNLRFSTSNHHSHFLAALHLPQLRECKVSCSYGLPWSLSVLQSFLEPSSHTLEDLTLTDLLLGGEYMDEILTLLPRLTRLCLFGTTAPPPAALGRLSGGVVGSRLTELSLGHIRLGPLFDMLEGRLAAARASDGGVTAFEAVSACCDSTDDAEDGRFGALRAAGMRVDITSWY